MTAEIIIMNKNAIALAADSVVTITIKENGETKRKTYEGANKLFMLSNDPPMGIMTYQNADFMNIPLETLIKEYKKRNDSVNKKTRLKNMFKSPLDSVESYMFDFLEFLERYCIKRYDENLINNYIHQQIKFLEDLIEKKGKTLMKKILKSEEFDKYNKIIKKDDFNKYDQETSRIMGLLEISQDEEKEYLKHIKSFILYLIFRDSHTGIVIAGFNSTSPFPQFCSVDIFNMDNKELKAINFKQKQIDNRNSSIIKPFAQSDVIENYLNGINPHITDKIDKYVDETLKNYPKSFYNILENIEEIDKENLDIMKKPFEVLNKFNNDLMDGLHETIDNAKNYLLEDVKGAVSVMPKEELASMSESLIHITSLKRKASSDIETVGGKIDVALITKGDGFIWIKRKHYFNSELNYHFFE
ncbi:MAG: hypothetical protein FWH29_07665 [Methanobrevibacter sp.]|nr:hypothetical protein [Methanobrevibacter sp.]